MPNFKRLWDGAVVAITDAGEEAPNLEPWIQWVTVHSGVANADHKCFDLNDGARLKAPRWASVLATAWHKKAVPLKLAMATLIMPRPLPRNPQIASLRGQKAVPAPTRSNRQ